jgi:hypothetical protein
VPGRYQVRLSANGRSETRSFAILKDPRVTTTAADFDAQLALLLRARDGLSEVYDGVRAVRAIRDQARDVVARVGAAGADVRDLRQQADALAAAATALEEELMQPRNQADQDTENFPTKLDNQLAYVYWKVAEPDAPPTAGQVERVADLLREKDVLLGRVRALVDRDVAAFNDLARRRGAAPITIAAPRPSSR